MVGALVGTPWAACEVGVIVGLIVGKCVGVEDVGKRVGARVGLGVVTEMTPRIME